MTEPQTHQSESATPATSPPPAQSLTAKQKLRAWLELSRISNLPTVWSNVLVGVAIGTVSALDYHSTFKHVPPTIVVDPWQLLWQAIVPMVAISFYYVAGMMLNDLFDLPVDRTERPGRPLPSGRICPRVATVAIVVLFAAGWVLLFVWSRREVAWPVFDGAPIVLASTGLIAAIVLYDWLHKRFAASIVLMGASRTLVYITAACTVPHSTLDSLIVWLLALVLGLYTIGITVIARGETQDRIDRRKWLAIVMPIAVLAMVVVKCHTPMIWPIVAGAALVMWLAPTIRYVFIKPPKTIKAILTWLSGMCLVDAYFLTLLGQPVLAAIAAGCFLLTAWGHRHILGT